MTDTEENPGKLLAAFKLKHYTKTYGEATYDECITTALHYDGLLEKCPVDDVAYGWLIRESTACWKYAELLNTVNALNRTDHFTVEEYLCGFTTLTRGSFRDSRVAVERTEEITVSIPRWRMSGQEKKRHIVEQLSKQVKYNLSSDEVELLLIEKEVKDASDV